MGRRKRPYNNGEPFRDAKMIVVMTEDSEATFLYFDQFREYYQNPRARIVPIEREDTNSAPKRTLDKLDETLQSPNFKSKWDIDLNYDEVWLVLDVDRWGDAKLGEVSKLARQKGYRLAISNPAIELWFLLHIAPIDCYTPQEKAELLENKRVSNKRTRLESAITDLGYSYNKSDLDVDQFLPHVYDAIAHAKQIDIEPNLSTTIRNVHQRQLEMHIVASRKM